MTRVHVIATAGRSVPMESSPNIIQDTPVAVILSHYYRRRIAAGELEVVEAPKPEEVHAAENVEGAGQAAPKAGAEASAPVVAAAPEPSRDSDESRTASNPDQEHTPSRRRAAP